MRRGANHDRAPARNRETAPRAGREIADVVGRFFRGQRAPRGDCPRARVSRVFQRAICPAERAPRGIAPTDKIRRARPHRAGVNGHFCHAATRPIATAHRTAATRCQRPGCHVAAARRLARFALSARRTKLHTGRDGATEHSLERIE